MWRTEEEIARDQIICPLNPTVMVNKPGEPIGKAINCIGSRCMMYRQNLITEDEVTQMKGYCGLAGLPSQGRGK